MGGFWGFGGSGAGWGGECFRGQSFTWCLRPARVFDFCVGWGNAACFLISWDPGYWVVRRVVGQLLYIMLISNNHTCFYIPCLEVIITHIFACGEKKIW